MPTTYDLNPRDIALYQRSNEYLSRLNALDPYSREYANVYNDYVDTIDQLSNRDFRASLNSTLLDFAPMTRPRAQPRVSEPEMTPYGIAVSSPNWKALPYTTAESQPRAANQQKGLSHMYADSSEPTPQGLALMQQVAPQTQEVTPYGITVHNPDWEAYPYTVAEPQSRNEDSTLSYIGPVAGPYGAIVPYMQVPREQAELPPSTVSERTVAPRGIYGAMSPVLQTAKESAQRGSSKKQTESQSSSTSSRRTPVPYGLYGAMTPVLETAGVNTQRQAEPNNTDYPQAIDLPPMMIEGIKPLVRYINNTTNTSIKKGQNTPVNIPSYFGVSPFMYSPPYAQALSELSELGKDIPGVYSWY